MGILIRTSKPFVREAVAADTENCYLFGDNTEDRTVTHHVPKFTQAVVRGLPNTIGIDTKKNRRTEPDSYLTDADYDTFKKHVDEQVENAVRYIEKTGGRIVVSAAGIGTGKAQLPKRAPRCFAYLTEKLNELNKINISDFIYQNEKSYRIYKRAQRKFISTRRGDRYGLR